MDCLSTYGGSIPPQTAKLREPHRPDTSFGNEALGLATVALPYLLGSSSGPG